MAIGRLKVDFIFRIIRTCISCVICMVITSESIITITSARASMLIITAFSAISSVSSSIDRSCNRTSTSTNTIIASGVGTSPASPAREGLSLARLTFLLLLLLLLLLPRAGIVAVPRHQPAPPTSAPASLVVTVETAFAVAVDAPDDVDAVAAVREAVAVGAVDLGHKRALAAHVLPLALQLLRALGRHVVHIQAALTHAPLVAIAQPLCLL